MYEFKKYIDFTESMKVTLYYGNTKQKAVNIIKNSDMLQYHYFSQDYKMVKSASIISILSITHNNIEYNIGFMCFSYSDVNKSFRNIYFDKNFLLNYIRFSKERDINTNFLTITRFVIMPYFRNLNLSKSFQKKTIDKILDTQEYKDITAIEIYSNLLYNFNFLCEEFEDILINQARLNKTEFIETVVTYIQEDIYGCKEASATKFGDKLLSLGGFAINHNHDELLKSYYLDKYNINIDFNKKRVLSNDIIINQIKKYKDKKCENFMPLIVLEKGTK